MYFLYSLQNCSYNVQFQPFYQFCTISSPVKVFFYTFLSFSDYSFVVTTKKNLLFRHFIEVFRQKRRPLYLFHKFFHCFLYIFYKHFHILCKINLFWKLCFYCVEHFFCQIKEQFYLLSVLFYDHSIIRYIVFIRCVIIFFQFLCSCVLFVF